MRPQVKAPHKKQPALWLEAARDRYWNKNAWDILGGNMDVHPPFDRVEPVGARIWNSQGGAS